MLKYLAQNFDILADIKVNANIISKINRLQRADRIN